VIIVARITPSSDAGIAKIPLAADFAKTPKGRRLLQVAVQDRGSIFRPYLLPPEVPKDRVQLLKHAFSETLKDSEFLSDAKKSNLNMDPVAGDEFEKIISNLFRLEPAFGSKLNEILR
jgi:hypothetical protein